MELVNNNLRLAMIFALSFVGNALFMEIPLMFFLIIFCSILLYKQKNNIDNTNIVIFMIISGILVSFFMKNIIEPRAYDIYYFMWPIYLIMFMTFCIKEDIFSTFRPPLFLTAILSIFFLIGAMIYEDETGRAYFIFGANVLYRLFLFLSFLQIIHAKNIVIKLFFFLIGIAGVYFTGSRMGMLLALGFYSIYFLSPYNNSKFSLKKSLKLVFIIPIILTFVALNFEFIYDLYNILVNSEGLISRLLVLTGGSISIRIQFLSTFLEHWSFFGTQSKIFEFFYFKDYFPYPHNIIAELIFYYGFLGIVISGIIIFEYAKTFIRFFKKITLSPIEIAFLIIFPSTLASGDIVDGLLVLFYSVSSFLIWCKKIGLQLNDKNFKNINLIN